MQFRGPHKQESIFRARGQSHKERKGRVLRGQPVLGQAVAAHQCTRSHTCHPVCHPNTEWHYGTAIAHKGFGISGFQRSLITSSLLQHPSELGLVWFGLGFARATSPRTHWQQNACPSHMKQGAESMWLPESSTAEKALDTLVPMGPLRSRCISHASQTLLLNGGGVFFYPSFGVPPTLSLQVSIVV